MSKITKLCFFISCFFFISLQAKASTLSVPSQYATIQQAINAAQNGDTVLVAPGTYVENINFIGKAITVMSTAGAQTTIIDGHQADVVVKFVSGESRQAILSGFTIQNGFLYPSGAGGIIVENSSSPTIRDNIISHNQACGAGGVLLSSGSPLLLSNKITENSGVCSGPGGGIVVNNASTAEIIGNTISNNFDFYGGGIAIFYASPKILQNTITYNGATIGGGLYIEGTGSAPLLQANNISYNFSNGGPGGGGISILGGASAQIINNVISNNNAGFNYFGGGISILGAPCLIKGNLISENYAGSGGGIYFSDSGKHSLIQNIIVKNRAAGGGGLTINSSFLLLNNTIADNDAPEGSAILGNFYPDSQIVNNLLIGKPGQPAFFCSVVNELPLFKNNNIYSQNGQAFMSCGGSQIGLNGNISAHPMFVDPAAGNYRLQIYSPGIDAGDNTAANLPATDFADNPRIFDGDYNGSAIVDIGAYEFGSGVFDLCIQDDSSKDVLRINTSTGAYQFIRCLNGFTVSGTGSIIRRGCTATFQYSTNDRRISATVNTCQNKATASVQIFAQGSSFALNDRNTTNNSCSCPNSN